MSFWSWLVGSSKEAVKPSRCRTQRPAVFEGLEGRALMSTATPMVSPTALVAKVSSSTAVKLNWSDNSSTETGYKIERSTDGKTFSQINTVGANVESYTSGSLTKGKKYYYRVRGYNSRGNSSYTNVASATPTTAPAVASALSVTTKTTKTSSGFANGGLGAYASGKAAFDGVSYTFDTPDQVNKAIPVLKSLHIGTVRVWWGMSSWNNRGGNWSVQVAQALHNAGFKVIMTFSVADVPSYATAYSFFNYAAHKSGAAGSIDYWEIGNEPNQKSFWKGSPSEYVNNLLKPAWDALHPSGEKVLGAGPTWDANFAKTLVSYGYLKYCDYAGFHPYGPSPQEVLNRATAAKAAYQGKPMIFTEWNVRGSEGNFSQWAQEVDQARKLIAHSAEIACYFPFAVGSTMAGKGGLVNTSYSARNPFFDMFKGWGE
jgi:hypothetical protein